MEDNLNFWMNGQPVILESGVGNLDYWVNGEPFVMLGEEETPRRTTAPLPMFFRDGLV